MFQNKCNLLTECEVEKFESGWGFYVDIEKNDNIFLANDEILRKKYKSDNDNDWFEQCNDCCQSTDINVDINGDKIPITLQIQNYTIKYIPTLIIVSIISYFIIFAL